MARVRFGRFVFDPDTGELTEGGVPVPLEPQPARLLALLVSKAGGTITRAEIVSALWPNVHVAIGPSVYYAIRHLRRALDDRATKPSFIATDGRRGYRFIAAVERDAPVRAATWPFTVAAAAACLAAILIAESQPNRHHELSVAALKTVHDLFF